LCDVLEANISVLVYSSYRQSGFW